MEIPVSTYRIQFSKNFKFNQLYKFVSYFSKLGITNIYASPIFESRKGGTSGYDIINPERINPEIGTEQEFTRLIKNLRKNKIGWLQDIVPNHMAFDFSNKPLTDIFKKGRKSKYYKFFDIDWNSHIKELKGKVLAPFLAEPYRQALENDKIKVSFGSQGFSINYANFTFPAKLSSYKYFLDISQNPKLKDIAGIKDESIIEKLYKLYITEKDAEKQIDKSIEFFNNNKIPLDKLLSIQAYKLSYWKVATEQINYRRFFTINHLICTNTQKPEVFKYLHSLVFDMCNKNYFSGLRIDHIDGLHDPEQYLKRLKRKVKNKYIIVEKILQKKEKLPESLPVEGTTGYDFLNYLNAIFCQKRNKSIFGKIYSSFIGKKINYGYLIYQKKQLILYKHMNGDLDNLTLDIRRIAKKAEKLEDIPFPALKRAVGEILCFLPVYRTYFSKTYGKDSKNYIKEAISKSIQKNPDLIYELNFLRRMFANKSNHDIRNFILKFQQLSGPLMAKGLEDTAFYIYNPLISLNEVGGFPDSFGVSLGEFYKFNEFRHKKWPHSLNATSTHDTKRGEDIRARINVLSEIPEQWKNTLKYWKKINKSKKEKIGRQLYPDRNDEYFLYQTLIGSYPYQKFDLENYTKRIKDYLVKSVREAKVHTAWIKPDEEYEEAFKKFFERLLVDRNFMDNFNKFFEKISHYGIFNSLSQLIIKITSPGIPDFYQGTELWDLNLVDPDNRKEVNFGKRIRLLDGIIKQEKKLTHLLPELLENKEDGRIKLFLTYKLIKQKKQFKDFFSKGRYTSFNANGMFGDNIISFGYKYGSDTLLAIAPRFLTSVIGENQLPMDKKVWKDTNINIEGNITYLKNLITGEKINTSKKFYIGDILNNFPVSLLLAKGG